VLRLYIVAAVVMLLFIKLLCAFTMAEGSRGASVLSTSSLLSSTASSTATEPSSLLRALILFMQYQIIVASVGVNWPAPLEVPMQGVAWVWSGASPETLAPDCLLRASSDSGGSLAVKRVMFYVLAPLTMLCVLVMLEVLSACASAAGSDGASTWEAACYCARCAILLSAIALPYCFQLVCVHSH
jgi:hypothetical protein